MPKARVQQLPRAPLLDPIKKKFKQRTAAVPRVVVTLNFNSVEHARAALARFQENTKMWVNYDAILKEEITLAAHLDGKSLTLVFFALTDLNTLRQNFDATFPQILPPGSSWAYGVTAYCDDK
jgi:hypothetical protein